ncbi:DUF1801 domain-containing protein [uncultured Brevundimonas sp.]|uniref:DUF1801 domain-containing protein n=1 Tax=uncultured Brevundimonas sp. TaxID=213418 RepID=UPI0025F60CAC|nr:DUF1801 domain-containing protein [uncultured Brevundimonas sp.]
MVSAPKTRPTDASVDDFLAAVEDPRRRADAEAVRDLMTEISGEPAVMWGTSIVGFGNTGGPTGDWPLIGFSPRKANLVLYVAGGFPEREGLVSRLGKVKTGVGCLYVARLDRIDGEVLRDLCDRSVHAMRSRHPG